MFSMLRGGREGAEKGARGSMGRVFGRQAASVFSCGNSIAADEREREQSNAFSLSFFQSATAALCFALLTLTRWSQRECVRSVLSVKRERERARAALASSACEYKEGEAKKRKTKKRKLV